MTALNAMVNACPECGASLKRLQMTCCCGWVRPHRTDRAKPPDLQCAYRNAKGRCPRRGNMNHNTRGSGGAWVCHTHFFIDQGNKNQRLLTVAPATTGASTQHAERTNQETPPDE